MKIDLNYSSRFRCDTCKTRCDGISKTAYIFSEDVEKSERDEDIISGIIGEKLHVRVRKTPAQAHGLADLEIYKDLKLLCRVEVKHQERTFMAVSRLLPHGKLLPYETIALNLSDLERYISQHQVDQVPFFIIWHVSRPCLGSIYCGNEISVLERLLIQYRDKRTFRRASTKSDYVNGEHKGVVVNFHFSLKEMIDLDEIIQRIANLS